MEKIKIHGVMMDNVTMDEALEYVIGRLDRTGTAKLYTPNSEIMMQAQRDPELKIYSTRQTFSGRRREWCWPPGYWKGL